MITNNKLQNIGILDYTAPYLGLKESLIAKRELLKNLDNQIDKTLEYLDKSITIHNAHRA